MTKLKKRIKDKGLKITWIAEQLKISQPALSMYLSGERTMPKDIELRIEKIIA